MQFRKSIVISTLVHVLMIFILPDFKFTQIQTDWVEVSMVTFPDIKDRLPDWQPGKKAVPKPSRELSDIQKARLPLPLKEEKIGIPVRSESPQMPEFTEDRAYNLETTEFKKVSPGRRDRKGLDHEIGKDDTMLISGPVTRRKLIRKVFPKYPVWAEEKGVEGEVDLKFWVSPEGMVSSVELIKTSGYPDLDSRAMEALKKYLFSPLGKDEEQKDQWGTITIKYTLR